MLIISRIEKFITRQGGVDESILWSLRLTERIKNITIKRVNRAWMFAIGSPY